MKNKISIKQEKFCHAFLETGNASEAYRQAYSISPDIKDSTVNRKACALLKNGKVAARVSELQEELKKASDITKDRVLDELSSIAFSDIRDFVEFDGFTIKFKSFKKLTNRQAKAVESIKATKAGIELKLSSKLQAIEKASRILGFDAATDFNISLEKLDESAIDLILNRIIQKK
ncbi:terminase small subunit [Gaoshiqia sp. Z1-71]|uniref:terminase small subunit n=1 Tax=Gaoshiqia hydrogeniformans TaxID=3290090 RepID=UPI003BF927BC